jgi:PAS domain S-box-containing protein
MPPIGVLLRRPAAIASIYVFLSLCWIFLSDLLVAHLGLGHSATTAISIVKGSIFVVSTAMLIFYLLRRAIQERDARSESEIRFQVLLDNVAERQKAEKKLQEFASELASLIEHAPYGIARASSIQTFRFVNPAFARMTGFESADEMRDLPVRQIFAKEDEFEEALETLLSTGIVNRELDWVKKDKSLFRVRLRCVHLLDGDCQITVEDISEAAKLEERIRSGAKMEAVGRLAGGIAHDFNNLLMVIQTSLEAYQIDSVVPPAAQKRLDSAMHASQRAAELTAQLLAFSRKQVLRPSIIDLNDAVREVTRMVERIIGEDIPIRLNCNPSLGAVKVDRSQLEQVIMNLAVNARDAMPAGGTLTIGTDNISLGPDRVALHPEATPGEYVALTITDTGIGMDPHTQSQIFEPFFTTKAPGRGTGLGLATTYGIIKQSRGFISVESELGRGTTFTILLPRVNAAADPARTESKPVTPHQGSGRILVVEDESMLRDLLSEYLSASGFEVFAAASTADALQIAEAQKTQIDAVLADMVLPDGNGITLRENLVKILPAVPIIFMSGYSPDVIGSRELLEGGTHFLEKPFSRSQLLQLLTSVLKRGGNSQDTLQDQKSVTERKQQNI